MIVIILKFALLLSIEWISRYKNEIFAGCGLSHSISKKLKEKEKEKINLID